MVQIDRITNYNIIITKYDGAMSDEKLMTTCELVLTVSFLRWLDISDPKTECCYVVNYQE